MKWHNYRLIGDEIGNVDIEITHSQQEAIERINMHMLNKRKKHQIY
jgi:hypothetical protein